MRRPRARVARVGERSVRVSLFSLLLTPLLMIGLAVQAQAAAKTWNAASGTPDSNWSTAGNWLPVGAPTAGDDLVFPNDPSLEVTSTNDFAPGTTFNTLTIQGQTVINGNGLTLTGDMTMGAGVPLSEINVGVTLGANASWTSSTAGGGLSVSQLNLNGFTWTVAGDGSIQPGDVVGAGAIVKIGSGVLVLGGPNSFTGTVTVELGVVHVTHELGLGSSAGGAANGTEVKAGGMLIVDHNGAFPADAFVLNGTGDGSGALVTTAPAVEYHVTGPVTLASDTKIAVSGVGLVFDTAIQGPGGLEMTGTGIVQLAAPGSTIHHINLTATNQTLETTTASALDAIPHGVTLGAGTTLRLLDHSTTVRSLSGAGALDLGVSVLTNLTIQNADACTFNGVISGAGQVTKTGAGQLTLGGTSTYTGQTAVLAGSLRVTSALALGGGGGATIVSADTTLILANVAIADEFLFLDSGVTPGHPATLFVEGSAATPSSLGGMLTVTNGSRVTGTTGALLIVNGQFQSPMRAALTAITMRVTTPVSLPGPLDVDLGGVFELGANDLAPPGTAIALGNTGSLRIGGHTATFSAIAGSGLIDLGTNGTLVLQMTSDATFAGNITGTGLLTKNGPAVWTLSGASTFAGAVAVPTGILKLTHADALTAAAVTVDYGGVLDIAAPQTRTGATTVSGYGFLNTPEYSGALRASGGNVTLNGPTTLAAPGAAIFVAPSRQLTLAGAVTGSATTGVDGGGTLVLANAATTFERLEAGILDHTATTVRLASAIAPLTLMLDGHAIFDLGGFDATLTGLGGFGTVAIGARTLTLSATGGIAFDGVFTGTGTITDVQSQAVFLSGAHTFNGAVTIDSGWRLEGSLPASIHVATPTSGLSMKGGIVTGALDFDGLFLEIGAEDAPAGVTVNGAFSLAAGSFFIAPLSQTTPVVRVNGPVSLAGGFGPLNLGALARGGTAILVDNDGADPVVGIFEGYSEGSFFDIGDLRVRISYVGGDGNDVTLSRPSNSYLLPEGATGPFFDTELLIANPFTVPVDATVTFLVEGASPLPLNYTFAPGSRQTILVDAIPGMEHAAFSTVVTVVQDIPLFVERTMRWDASNGGYGAHTDKAVDGPHETWYFAEGSEGFFHTFLLLANPETEANRATVTWLREGESPLVRTYDLEPSSRRTIVAAEDAEIAGRSFGIAVQFDKPGAAERAMYFGDSPIWKGGHESAGVTAPARDWFLAEGATGEGFDTFILVANPGQTAGDVTFNFLTESAAPATLTRSIAPGERLTINIEAAGLTIPDGPVATVVSSTVPVVAERAQYWPLTFDRWTEAHNSFGMTETGRTWVLAEGRAGGAEEYQTYILLANPGDTDASVQLTFLPEGTTPAIATRKVTVPAQRRVTVPVSGTDLPQGTTTANFGTVINSDRPIVVERALYWNVNGEVWAAGTNATATRLY